MIKSKIFTINNLEVLISNQGCDYSVDFFNKVKKIVYDCFSTNENDCKLDVELFCNCLSASNRILEWFLEI